MTVRVYLQAARLVAGPAQPGDLPAERVFIHAADVPEFWVETESANVPPPGRAVSFTLLGGPDVGFERVEGTVERRLDKHTKERLGGTMMGDPTTVDLVIVGAGAAGLAAARTAGELGLDFVVFEAMERIGGRAHTDQATFGVPWDRGCHWLHSADVNPLRDLADAYGFHYLRETPPFAYHFGDRRRAGEEAREIRAYVDACWAEIAAAGATGADIPASAVIDQSQPLIAAFRTTVAGEWGVGLDEVSTLDDAAYRDTGCNWPLREGYGALIARHAAGLPVMRSTPVERIEWSGPRVRVTTPVGTIESAAVVVTVSVKVIQDGLIVFDPPLPVWKQEAYDAIALGNANKVAFAIDGRHLGGDGHEGLWVTLTEAQGMLFQLRPFGWDLANGYLAGPLGAELEREGPEAMLAAGRTALQTAFGNDIIKHITASACSTWQREPWIRGAYGAARPGLAHKRADLGIPIDNRLFFAGEAISRDWFSTCHGAHLTGIAAARRVAAALGGVPASGPGGG